MNWLYYLLEANLYLAAFYVMYKLLLQRSTFYNSNRYFLILSVAAAFTIPLMQLGFLKAPIILEEDLTPYEIPLETFEIVTIAKAPALTTQDYIFYGYLALALFLSLKFIFSISKIVKIYLSSNKRKLSNYTLVELSAEHTAFSFFNILFIHPEMAKNSAVLKHEIIHIKQKHSWDIILLELLKICCWFNPVVYLMKKDLTLLHEYIADEKTTAANISKHEYAMFLIENSMAAYSSSLVNQLFNQSILKSRINMLNKEKTANWARLKYLLAVPLGVGLLCASTLGFSKSYGYLEIGEQKVVQQKSQKVTDELQMAKKGFYSPSYIFDEKENYKSLEKRLIVVNGVAVKDNNKFYGANNAENILFLNSEKASRKYGVKAKYGAVEVYGKKLVMTAPYVIADTAKFPAPKQDQIKFPPTYKPKNQKSYAPEFRLNKKTGKPISTETSLFIINGQLIADNNSFYGVRDAESILVLSRIDAVKKYGEKGKYGAVEIKGKDLRLLTTIITKPAPPIEPQPARYLPENQTSFYPRNAYNNKKLTKVDKRLIVINGEFVEDNGKFYGVTNAKEVVILNAKEATKIYGKKGINGAVQISGDVKGTGLVEPPPSLYKSPIEIDRNKGDLLSFSKVSEVKALTIYDRWGKVIYNNPNYNDDWDTKKGNYENYDGKELASGTYYYFLKVNEAPEKSMRGWFFTKGQGLKPTPNEALNKTGTIKKVNGIKAEPKATTAKSAFEKTNNVFSKAWTLYKPKVEENKNDNC